MNSKIRHLINNGQIIRDESFKALARKFIDKSRTNLITMNLLLELNLSRKARNLLKVPEIYDANEWIVISGYYAMYSSALALIARIGFRSKTHTATIILLDEFYVKKNLLDQEDLHLISNVYLKNEELEQLSDAKHKREIAQYSVTKKVTKNIADNIKMAAYAFVNKAEEIIEN